MPGKLRLLAIVITLILVLASLEIFYNTHGTKTITSETIQPSSTTTSEASQPPTYDPAFSFNLTLALSFYSRLAVPIGGGDLLQTYPGSDTIYLSDDQALDYYALQSISNASSQVRLEALEINSSISSFGGFYEYWNPVFVVLGDYPSVWTIEQGLDENISSTVSSGVNYSIMATVFSPSPGFNFSEFADLDFCYSLWNLHEGNYTVAESAFQTANSFWNGYGFQDNASSPGDYASYKLALAVITWKSLEANPNTAAFAKNYVPEIKNVTSIMSQLQGDDGGVWTNYEVNNGQIVTGTNISFENGETTSLFVIAADK